MILSIGLMTVSLSPSQENKVIGMAVLKTILILSLLAPFFFNPL